MSDNTYGPFGLHIGRLRDIEGKYINEDTLFLHLYDYWTNFHDPNKRFLWWRESIMIKIEKNIRKKWVKDLPDVAFVLERIKANNQRFNSSNFFEKYDSENYFELLVIWKEKYEHLHLLERPRFRSYRHKKY